MILDCKPSHLLNISTSLSLILAILTLAVPHTSLAFSPSNFSPIITTPSIATTTSSSSLCAKKQNKSSSSKVSSKISGTGFGSAPTSAKLSSRTVSGYTGSGTKVLRIAANTFDSIRKQYGKEATTDVYIKSPLNDPLLCWYVGKVVRRLDPNDSQLQSKSIPTESDAILSQKRLIIEYAKNQLRPQNFNGPYANSLELWMAPGDSEMDVVQNKVSLVKINGSLNDLSDGFSVNDVGFNPEIYVGDERNEGGLRVKRDENGDPVKAAFEI